MAGGTTRHHGHRFFNEQLVNACGVESRHQNQRCPENQRGIENHIQSVDVIERETAQDVIGGVDGVALGPMS